MNKCEQVERIDCEQGTDEWYAARLGIPTASGFSKVVTNSGEISKQRRDYAIQLASELITYNQDEHYQSFDMQRGKDVEPEAREVYEQENLIIIEKVGFLRTDYCGYSPDGFVGSDGLIEIKCPKQNTHTKYLYNHSLPSEYKAQVQGGLFVSNRKWCDFISYNPNFHEDKRLFVKRISRDEAFIESLRKGLDALNKYKNEILEGILRNTNYQEYLKLQSPSSL